LIDLTLNPSTTLPWGSVTATTTANDGSLYDSGAIRVRASSCTGSTMCQGSNCLFSAPSVPGVYSYFACLGQNQAFAPLTIIINGTG